MDNPSGPSLGLDYGDVTPRRLLARLEEEARRRGLPLDLVELIGSHPGACKSFLRACERGDADAYLNNLDVDALREWRDAGKNRGSFFRRLLGGLPPGMARIG